MARRGYQNAKDLPKELQADIRQFGRLKSLPSDSIVRAAAKRLLPPLRATIGFARSAAQSLTRTLCDGLQSRTPVQLQCAAWLLDQLNTPTTNQYTHNYIPVIGLDMLDAYEEVVEHREEAWLLYRRRLLTLFRSGYRSSERLAANKLLMTLIPREPNDELRGQLVGKLQADVGDTTTWLASWIRQSNESPRTALEASRLVLQHLGAATPSSIIETNLLIALKLGYQYNMTFNNPLFPSVTSVATVIVQTLEQIIRRDVAQFELCRFIP
jgi:hypothetical protein